jgi:hypothetical protein
MKTEVNREACPGEKKAKKRRSEMSLKENNCTIDSRFHNILSIGPSLPHLRTSRHIWSHKNLAKNKYAKRPISLQICKKNQYLKHRYQRNLITWNWSSSHGGGISHGELKERGA